MVVLLKSFLICLLLIAIGNVPVDGATEDYCPAVHKYSKYMSFIRDTNISQYVQFYLFTRKNNTGEELELNNKNSWENSNFNSSWPIRVIVHGWLGKIKAKVVQLIKTAYLEKNNFNVIAVDWGAVANNLYYYLVAKQVLDVGKILAQFIKSLSEHYKISYSDIYFIGHSLGSHVVGYAGFLLNSEIGVIFGLDPAGPLFPSSGGTYRSITRIDAQYVEIIHTSSLGIQKSVGKANMYANNGIDQNGCLWWICSHSRAYKYFAESINSKHCLAYQCNNFQDMLNQRCISSGSKFKVGGEPATRKLGNFFFPTGKHSPFCSKM